MVHTYRDPALTKSRFFGPGFPLVFLVFVIAPFAFLDGPIWLRAIFPGSFLLVQYLFYRQRYQRGCAEIRLSDDGTCEIETKRNVIRLHVNEVRQVEHTLDDDPRREYCTIHYNGRKTACR